MVNTLHFVIFKVVAHITRCIFFLVPGIELRILHFPGRCYATELHIQPTLQDTCMKNWSNNTGTNLSFQWTQTSYSITTSTTLFTCMSIYFFLSLSFFFFWIFPEFVVISPFSFLNAWLSSFFSFYLIKLA